jgi:hypothetical protein
LGRVIGEPISFDVAVVLGEAVQSAIIIRRLMESVPELYAAETGGAAASQVHGRSTGRLPAALRRSLKA